MRARPRLTRRPALDIGVSLALPLAFACTFNSEAASTATDPDDTTSSSDAADAASTVGSPSDTASAPTGSSDPDDGSATNDPTLDPDDSGDTTAGPASELVDDGLLVRYFFDEAKSAAPNRPVRDAGPAPALDLTVTYDADDMQPEYVAAPNGRGLRWFTHGEGGRAQAAVAGSKLATLDGATELTVEVVVDVTSVFLTDEPWARVIVIQPDVSFYGIDLGVLAVWDEDAFALDLRASWLSQDGPPIARWRIGPAPGRIVAHLVIDTEVEALRMFVGGAEVPSALMTPPRRRTELAIANAAQLVVGNRPANNTSLGGTVYYAAIYDRALTDPEVALNAAILAIDDDE